MQTNLKSFYYESRICPCNLTCHQFLSRSSFLLLMFMRPITLFVDFVCPCPGRFNHTNYFLLLFLHSYISTMELADILSLQARPVDLSELLSEKFVDLTIVYTTFSHPLETVTSRLEKPTVYPRPSL